MALNVVLGRDIPGIQPLFPHQDPSSSPISQSISSSVSLASASTSSSIVVSTSFSTTSSTIPPSTFSEPPQAPLTVTPTNTVTTIASPASSSVAAGSPQTGFLQNKVLSGVVFGIAGLVGLILFILLATFAIRRRRHKKLIEDAVSFDPGNYHKALESGLGENVRASVSTGHISNGPEVRQSPAFIDYAPPAKRSYLPSSNMPSSSPSQGQHNVTAQAYASTYD